MTIDPFETVEITAAERNRIMDATFRVITVVPTIERPHCNTYIVDQDELRDFLADVQLRTECLVAIEEVAGDFADLLRPAAAEH